MSITPANLLEFAKAECGNENETLRRAALSRAYYCAYHCLVPSVEPIPSVNSEENDGYLPAREILHRLGAWNVAKWPSLGAQRPVADKLASKFRILRDMRVKADYFLDAEVSPEAAQEANERAADIKKAAFQLKIAIEKAQSM